MQNFPRKQHAFILVATIWMLAAATLVAGAFAIWVQRNLELVSQQSEYTQNALNMVGTKSTVLYLLSTQSKNQGGLTLPSTNTTPEGLPETFFDPLSNIQAPILGNEIRLDNRPYIGVNESYFALQDVAGLININSPTSPLLSAYLLAQGYSKQEKNALVDKLADYIDGDDFHRVLGAESFHYQKQNLPPPPNKKLKSVFELKNVLGWRAVTENVPDIFNQLTAGNAFLININTANEYALSLLNNVGPKRAKQLVQARNEQAFTTLAIAGQKIGTNLDNLYSSITTSPSRFTRLHLWYKNSRLIEHFSIQLTPTSKDNKPWKINSSFALPIPQDHDNQQPIKPQTALFDSTVSAAKD